VDKDSKASVEVPLGQYSVTVSRPNASTSLRVDFELVGTVLEEEAAEMSSLFDRHVHRFRDQILYEIRNSEPADLADPGLGLIKRRILEKSNALFGKPILRSVVFSQFSYIEQ
jgi:flagellar FliL protein